MLQTTRVVGSANITSQGPATPELKDSLCGDVEGLPMVCIVIPYFQRVPGTLARALRSAISQTYAGPMSVIVADDESPVPARDELSRLGGGESRCAITIVSRPNGGPAAARNTALDACPPETKYIAFLDSDDEWDPLHIENGVRALSHGFDVYFADHVQLGQDVGAFRRAGRIEPTQHHRLGADDWLRAFDGDMFDQIIRGNVIGTSTVILDWERFHDSRFREELTSAGEDYLFWMELAVAGAKYCFSTRIEARYGKGVNVYSGAGWGTDGYMPRLYNELRFLFMTRRLFQLTGEQARQVSERIERLRLAFAADLLHRIAARKKLNWRLLRMQLRLDPTPFFQVPTVALRRIQRSKPDE